MAALRRKLRFPFTQGKAKTLVVFWLSVYSSTSIEIWKVNILKPGTHTLVACHARREASLCMFTSELKQISIPQLNYKAVAMLGDKSKNVLWIGCG